MKEIPFKPESPSKDFQRISPKSFKVLDHEIKQDERLQRLEDKIDRAVQICEVIKLLCYIGTALGIMYICYQN